MELDKELVIASENGAVTTVSELLEKGANPDAMGPNSGALHCACANGHHAIVKLLLEKGANPNIADQQSFYPLHLAVAKKELEICQTLISHAADVQVLTNIQGSVLHIAAAIDFYQVLEIPEIKALDLEAEDQGEKTALHVAASLGNLEMVKALIGLGANIHTTDHNNDSPLLSALLYMDSTKVAEWSSVGENEGVKAKYEIINGCFRYITPYNGNPDELGEVLDRESQKEICSFDWGPKAHIRYLNCLEVVEFLIAQGADIEVSGSAENTPMIYACSIGEPHLIRELAQKGASFQVSNKLGITPLHYLSRSKRLDGLIAYYEVNKDKNSNLLDQNGWTPGHFLADIGGHPGMAKLLVANNLDLTIGSSEEYGPYKKGIKAFEVAEHWNDDTMAQLLKS